MKNWLRRRGVVGLENLVRGAGEGVGSVFERDNPDMVVALVTSDLLPLESESILVCEKYSSAFLAV